MDIKLWITSLDILFILGLGYLLYFSHSTKEDMSTIKDNLEFEKIRHERRCATPSQGREMNKKRDEFLLQKNHGSYSDFLRKRVKRSGLNKKDNYEIPKKGGI